MKKVFAILAIATLAGCASNNIKSFKTDDSIKYKLKDTHFSKVFVQDITMPENDQNAIMCRLAGNIYLPNKMTYSAYIEDAFKKTLFALDKLSNDSADGHKMSIKLTNVTFNSLSGKWYIDGDVTVDNHAPIAVKSESEFGTSYDAWSACKNTAEAFDEAVAHFIKVVLTDTTVHKHLH